jgi:hypothetical protein
MKADTIDDALNAVKIIHGALVPLDEVKRAFVLKTVAELLGTSSPLSSTPKTPSQPQQTPAPAPLLGLNATSVGTANKPTAKDFLKEKKPATDTQQIVCLAYYLTHFMDQPKFKTKDLTKLNSDAGGGRLSNPSMTVSNADRQSRLLSPAGSGRKQITARGEELVNSLPNQEAAKTILRALRKYRKRRSLKAPAK